MRRGLESAQTIFWILPEGKPRSRDEKARRGSSGSPLTFDKEHDAIESKDDPGLPELVVEGRAEHSKKLEQLPLEIVTTVLKAYRV